ncbi:glucosaminidase domain-containing protein [Oxalobacteraceae bacterium]|nr:glucosaminidase domain-containing protein [Oxalobacteraceae bacterium]
MRPLEPTRPTAATVSNMGSSGPVAVLPASFGGGGNFSSTFQRVQGEVANFIAHGGAGASAATALSAEGMAVRARASGAIDGNTGNTEGAAAAGADPARQQEFLASIQPWAAQAAEKLGVAPELVAAHAALESGWGQRQLPGSGAGGHNLFGIKAGVGWQGEVASAATTEFEHGLSVRKTERFRSYADPASAFNDYASLIKDNPRYAAALNTGSDAHAFAQGLAQGGYASDPQYAAKLSKLALQLQGGAAAKMVRQSGD